MLLINNNDNRIIITKKKYHQQLQTNTPSYNNLYSKLWLNRNEIIFINYHISVLSASKQST